MSLIGVLKGIYFIATQCLKSIGITFSLDSPRHFVWCEMLEAVDHEELLQKGDEGDEEQDEINNKRTQRLEESKSRTSKKWKKNWTKEKKSGASKLQKKNNRMERKANIYHKKIETKMKTEKKAGGKTKIKQF